MTAKLALLVIMLLSGSAFGQLPPVGIIDFYGLGTLTENDVLAVLGIQPGSDAMEVVKSAEDRIKRLKALPNVEDATVSLVCCDSTSRRSIVFIGLREKGAAALTFRKAPPGNVRLPEEISRAGADFEAAFTKAAQGQDFSEDDSDGHSLFGNAEVRAAQRRFIQFASTNLDILRRVLRESSDARHRALAAQIIAYSPHKEEIVPDLAHAMTDPDSTVRNNAMRALLILAKYARANPRFGNRVPTIGFVRMLNSLIWTDRNKAAGALDVLTRERNKSLLAELKKHALPSLTEMARWQSSGHAEASFFILGRIARIPEEAIQSAFAAPDRKDQIRMILNKIAGSKSGNLSNPRYGINGKKSA